MFDRLHKKKASGYYTDDRHSPDFVGRLTSKLSVEETVKLTQVLTAVGRIGGTNPGQRKMNAGNSLRKFFRASGLQEAQRTDD